MGVKLRFCREGNRPRVFENRVLMRILGPNGDEIIGGWRKLHNEELHNVHFLLNIIRTIKLMKWAGHVGFWYKNLKQRDHQEDIGEDSRIILKWILEKWDEGGYGLDSSGSG
jgi:hypothetical protein